MDLIDRNKLKEFHIRLDNYDAKNGDRHFINGIESLMEYAESLPTIDVMPAVHSRWTKQDNGTHFCLDCGCDALWSIIDYNGTITFREVLSDYCPTCGAKMDEVEREEDDE